MWSSSLALCLASALLLATARAEPVPPVTPFEGLWVPRTRYFASFIFST
jgi:hypothetical protein